MREPSGSTILHTVDKAMRVLFAVADANSPIGVTELAERVGTNPTTVYKILNTLRKYNLVERENGSSRYRIGPAALKLGTPSNQDREPRHIARPLMKALAQTAGESVTMMVLSGHRGMYVEAIEGPQSIRMVVGVGTQRHLHACAAGKVLLAYLPHEQAIAIMDSTGLERLTRRTITDRHLFLDQLALIRKRGYAIDDEECEEGTRCVAAAVFDAQGEIVASIGISGPEFRLSLSRMESLVPHLHDVCRDVSRKLGYCDEYPPIATSSVQA